MKSGKEKEDLRKEIKKIRENKKKKNTCIVCPKCVCSLTLTILSWQVGFVIIPPDDAKIWLQEGIGDDHCVCYMVWVRLS